MLELLSPISSWNLPSNLVKKFWHNSTLLCKLTTVIDLFKSCDKFKAIRIPQLMGERNDENVL